MAGEKSQPPSLTDLRGRLARAPGPKVAKPVREQARRALLAWFDTAVRHGITPRDALRKLANGDAAHTIGMALLGEAERRPGGPIDNAACRAGCAFCCILPGQGGTITRTEAGTVHTALAALPPGPDGRTWHAEACPALDPSTRTCRIYDDRPLLCRSFLSTDGGACEANANGASEPGPVLLAPHLISLAVTHLVRTALRGLAGVETFALGKVAASAVDGAPLSVALAHARERPRVLDDGLKAGLAPKGRVR